MNIGTASENYLETMYLIYLEKDQIRSIDISDRMNVSRASVNKALGVLKNEGLVKHEHYGQVSLTDSGFTVAKEILNRHITIKNFLIDILKIDETTAEIDACKMEHILSKETLLAIKNYKK